MRYQLTALIVALLTLIALAAVAFVISLQIGREDSQHRQDVVNAEFRSLEVALATRADALRAHAITLLQRQDVRTFAVSGGNAPLALTQGRTSRGGADYIVLSGPARRVVMEEGLTDSILVGGAAATPAGTYLVDGALDGGIFAFREGPVLAAGASTGSGTERVAIALGLRLTPELLAALLPGRTVTLSWEDAAAAASGPPVVAPMVVEQVNRVVIVGPLSLSWGDQPLVATVSLPRNALPAPSADLANRWLIGLVLTAAAGLLAFGVAFRVMAAAVGEMRSGLLAAQETDGNPAVLDALSSSDEVGRTAAQAALTLRHVRERTDAAIEEARTATARQLLGEHVIRSMHEGVLVERSDGTCIVCNPAAALLVNVEPRSLLGRRDGVRDVLGADLYARLRERAHDPAAAQRLEVVALSGRDLAFDAYEVPEYGSLAGPDASSLLVIIRDVSAVLEVEQLKRDVVSVVSHELRSPLTVIALSLELLHEPEARQAELIAAAERNVQRMREVVDDLLDLARLESGQAEPNLQPVNVLELCRDIIRTLAPQASEKRITVRDATDGDVPTELPLDRRQMERALTNLVANALKFSPPGSDVWVILRRDGDHLYIDVADAGPGIPEAEQERVFSRFYRATNTREAVTGTGLGLPIVRRIAELHGGTALALPAQRGAYLRISLPLR